MVISNLFETYLQKQKKKKKKKKEVMKQYVLNYLSKL